MDGGAGGGRVAILLFLPVYGVCALPISQEIGAVEEVILSCLPLTAVTVTPRCVTAVGKCPVSVSTLPSQVSL